MPKRDAAYMQGQREMIARAARECILEKGVAATSTREICIAAGVSKGALYSHYKTREDVIAEACLLDPIVSFTPVDNWADYERQFSRAIEPIRINDRYWRLLRAAYEFVAEVMMMDRMPPEIEEQWILSTGFVRDSLRIMHERGEIALPLGLEATVDLHVQQLTGAQFCLCANPGLDVASTHSRLLTSLAFTAGRKA